MAGICIECCAGPCTRQLCIGQNQTVARYLYGGIFLLTNLMAWIIRDYSDNALASLHYFKGCQESHDCLATEGVLRISMGCFTFFCIMFVTTIGTSRTDDARYAWHCGWWPLKGLLWIILMVLPFFTPASFVKLYGEVARFGAGIFLAIQLVSVINFIYWWNECWVSGDNARKCYIPLVVTTIACFGIFFAGIIFMYIQFAPRASCSLNIFFITWTLILTIVMTTISLHSKVNAGLMTSALVAVYLTFLCWSSIMSEPRTELCNTRPRQTGRGDWLTILSFLLGVLAIVFATMSTGVDSKTFSSNDELDSQKNDGNGNHLHYGYGFFHFIFAMGAMYFAMLFVGWNLHQTMHKWTIDYGWASVWVKMVNEWLAAAVYIWTMVNVFIIKHRNFAT